MAEQMVKVTISSSFVSSYSLRSSRLMAQAFAEEIEYPLQANCLLRTPISSSRSRPNSEESIANGCCHKDDEGPKDLSLQEHNCKDSNQIDRAKYQSEEKKKEETGRGVPEKALPIRELKLDGCRELRGREAHSFTSTAKRRRTYSMANSESRNTTSLDTASQEHNSSSSVSSASDTPGERPASFGDENDVECFKDSSPKQRNTTGQMSEYSSSKCYVKRINYSSLLNNLRVCGDEILRVLGGSISGPEDDCDRPATAGSELTTAAYNNFVRRIVDDTLDRTITFCEQPRYAITALETICAKAWPRMEMKRHRNRIRAYLKACRRNSKKNKGKINMKGAPMNGLSIEARQLVSNALSLVADDVDQLKRDDIDYFRHNMELSREAIQYVKGVARLILKKTELLESQLNFPMNGIYLNPLNLS